MQTLYSSIGNTFARAVAVFLVAVLAIVLIPMLQAQQAKAMPMIGTDSGAETRTLAKAVRELPPAQVVQISDRARACTEPAANAARKEVAQQDEVFAELTAGSGAIAVNATPRTYFNKQLFTVEMVPARKINYSDSTASAFSGYFLGASSARLSLIAAS